MGPAPRKVAFSLIELLVVLTIIVVLVALLAPALDQAVYHAELAACGATERALGVGVMTYASDSKRRYPYRPTVARANARTSLFFAGNYSIDEQYGVMDDRTYLRNDHFSIDKMFQCPLSQDVDLERNDPATWVYGDLEFWFGWRYGYDYRTGNNFQQGMMKVGDRLAWNDERFNVLAADMDQLYYDVDTSVGAHPDYDGTMVSLRLQDDGGAAGAVGGSVTGKNTIGVWVGQLAKRGPIDRNILFDDVSVRRYNNVTSDEHTRADGRFVRVPPINSDAVPAWDSQLPPMH